jgi:hypothetical protein
MACRISKKCVSFRKVRERIAKRAFTGKTMKLYLKLNPANYNEKVYFQKDVSAKKAYSEVPMLVKIRSDRAFKNAIKLIEELMVVNNVEAKKRYAVYSKENVFDKTYNTLKELMEK